MFLHVERARVERPHVAEGGELPSREDMLEKFTHGKSDQLNDKWANSDGWPCKEKCE